jgi:ubiquinone/menaquinone biosynthesis C-methylase UbiE
MNARQSVVNQFKQPHGPLGHLAGWIMATRPSNLARNDWTIGLLAIEPHHRVLEIGFGPGYAVAQVASRLTSGQIVGIDHSEVMLKQAQRRNAGAVRQGRVKLLCQSVAHLKRLDGRFDRVFSANVAQFWDDRVSIFKEILRLLAPKAKVATTFQPRHPKATDQDAVSFGELIVEEMKAAGFPSVRLEQGPRAPVLTVCAIGEV